MVVQKNRASFDERLILLAWKTYFIVLFLINFILETGILIDNAYEKYSALYKKLISV